VQIITQTKYKEEKDGREDYPLSKKLSDLRLLREVMAIMGWSYGDVRRCSFAKTASLLTVFCGFLA
jgi:hypothetical protein